MSMTSGNFANCLALANDAKETLLTSRLTDSMTSRNTSFFLYLRPSDLHDTALVTAIGGRGAISNLCPSWVIYL